jgi:hypothetical protein
MIGLEEWSALFEGILRASGETLDVKAYDADPLIEVNVLAPLFYQNVLQGLGAADVDHSRRRHTPA